ncbi:MAG: hypothetical protein ACM3N9_03065 [Syntrophothermus sp.]
MKQKIFLVAGILLLLLVIGVMTKDLFFHKPAAKVQKDLVDSLKTGDARLLYRPLFFFQPGMEEITGVVAGNNDRIFVCGTNAVKIFDIRGKLLTTFPISGTPGCMTLDEAENIYLGMTDHLLVLDPSGKEKMKWKHPDTSSVITSISVHGNKVAFADAGLKTVFLTDLSGKKIRRIGEKDPARNIPGYIIPSPYFDVFLTKDDSLWVANTGRHELEKYSLNGDLVSKWGIPGMTPDAFCGCCNPSHFTFLSDGTFVTSEKGIPRVKVYDHNGLFLGMVALPEEFEDGTRGLDVAADSNDRILVLDPVKKRITIYVKS